MGQAKLNHNVEIAHVSTVGAFQIRDESRPSRTRQSRSADMLADRPVLHLLAGFKARERLR
jgi:hypothetical protein